MAALTPPPFDWPGYALPFWVAFALWFLPELLRSRTKISDAASRKQDRGSLPVVIASVYAAIFAAFACAFALSAAQIVGGRFAAFALGIACILTGTVFRAYAVSVLGRSFTFDVATRADQTVCDRGPYKYVRHPSYTGTLLSIAGIGLALCNWASVVVALAVASAAYAYRVRVEERALSEALGAPYDAYMKRTRRFIPFVY